MTDHWITKGRQGGSHKKLDLFCQKNQINWWRIECHLTTINSNNDPESQRKVETSGKYGSDPVSDIGGNITLYSLLAQIKAGCLPTPRIYQISERD